MSQTSSVANLATEQTTEAPADGVAVEQDLADSSMGDAVETGEAAEATEKIVDTPFSLTNDLPSLIELLPEPIQPYWVLIQQIPLLDALIIILFFWALAYLIRRYAISMIERITVSTQTELDDQIVEELRGPIFSTVIWVGVLIGIAASDVGPSIASIFEPAVMSIIVLIWLRAALTVSGILFTAMSRDTQRFKKIDIRTEPLLIIASKLAILVIGAYVLLIIWGINPVGLLASAGIVGIAVGFAAKDTLANLFSGVFILADRPYKLGDYVNLDTGERGKVTHIGIRSTRILTRDDIEVTVPNGVIGNAKVVNESGGPYQKMRVRIDVQCAYDADLEEVCEVLMDIANQDENLSKYPSPRVRIRGFAESGIDIQLLGWINHPEDRGRITHSMYMKIHAGFREAGLEIPYPKRDITILEPASDSAQNADLRASEENSEATAKDTTV